MRLYLVRHAQPLSHHADDDVPALPDHADGLSDAGRLQAAALASSFAPLLAAAGTRLLSSTLPRAAETAALLAGERAQAVEHDARLNELALRLAGGATERDSRALQLGAIEHPHESMGGSERLAEHRARVAAWFSELCNSPRRPAVCIVVSHGGTMEHVMGLVLGAPVEGLRGAYIDCPCAHYHGLSEFEPRADWRAWRVDYIARAPEAAPL